MFEPHIIYNNIHFVVAMNIIQTYNEKPFEVNILTYIYIYIDVSDILIRRVIKNCAMKKIHNIHKSTEYEMRLEQEVSIMYVRLVMLKATRVIKKVFCSYVMSCKASASENKGGKRKPPTRSSNVRNMTVDLRRTIHKIVTYQKKKG